MPVIATGAGVAEIAGVSKTIPNRAVELVAVRASYNRTKPAPAELMEGVVILGGQLNHAPSEFLTEIGCSKVGAVDQQSPWQKPAWQPMRVSVTPSGTLDVAFEPFDVVTDGAELKVDFRWSDTPSPATLPSILRKCSRETSTATTSGAIVALENAQTIIRMVAGVGNTTVTADDPFDGKIALNSGAFNDQQTIELGAAVYSIEATSGVGVSFLEESPQSINIKDGINLVNVQSTLTEETALATAGLWFWQLDFIPRGFRV